MAQDIVADDMIKALTERVEFWQTGFDRGIHNQTRPLRVLRHRSKGEYPRRFRINFEINRNTAPQKSGHIFFSFWYSHPGCPLPPLHAFEYLTVLEENGKHSDDRGSGGAVQNPRFADGTVATRDHMAQWVADNLSDWYQDGYPFTSAMI